jgi:glucosyl-dolichyl phosphate glucuronosyltransferase
MDMTTQAGCAVPTTGPQEPRVIGRPDSGASAPTVSVIVCAYTMDRWALLERALRSVRSQTLQPIEVLLIVDHCPQLRARATDLGGGVRVMANLGPPGLSAARNTGVEAARGEVVVFLDDDAMAAPDWLEHLIRPYADRQVAAVGGRVIAEWAEGKPDWFPEEFNWVVGCSYVGQPTDVSPVRNPIGANMSFRREAVLSAGGFSSCVGRVGARPSGCEETELSIRVARQVPGSSILLEPRAVVHHHVPAGRSRWRYFRQRCWAEGVSKAFVSRLAGPRSALASERSYALRTLPRGAARGLDDAVRRGDPSGLGRSLAITAGLALTTAGYLAGRIAGKIPRTTAETVTRQPEVLEEFV